MCVCVWMTIQTELIAVNNRLCGFQIPPPTSAFWRRRQSGGEIEKTCCQRFVVIIFFFFFLPSLQHAAGLWKSEMHHYGFHIVILLSQFNIASQRFHQRISIYVWIIHKVEFERVSSFLAFLLCYSAYKHFEIAWRINQFTEPRDTHVQWSPLHLK